MRKYSACVVENSPGRVTASAGHAVVNYETQVCQKLTYCLITFSFPFIDVTSNNDNQNRHLS
jgi:hypothetical protein